MIIIESKLPSCFRLHPRPSLIQFDSVVDHRDPGFLDALMVQDHFFHRLRNADDLVRQRSRHTQPQVFVRTPVEPLVFAVFDEDFYLAGQFQKPPVQDRPEKVGVHDIGMVVFYMFAKKR